ncbi:La-Related Protein 6 [Manis pentadactyla]|nr:La-Related Protein 6 [Manis pentadactyla]
MKRLVTTIIMTQGSCVGEYIGGMLVTIPGCHVATLNRSVVRRALVGFTWETNLGNEKEVALLKLEKRLETDAGQRSLALESELMDPLAGKRHEGTDRLTHHLSPENHTCTRQGSVTMAGPMTKPIKK